MSKKEETKEPIKEEEKKAPTKETKKEDKSEKKVKELEKEIKSLKDTIINLNISNAKLEEQINAMNKDFISKVTTKAKEAQEKLDVKINEYKNNFDEKVKDVKKYALEKNALEFIQAIDTFKMALKTEHTIPEVNAFVAGFKMIYTLLDNALKSAGINQISIKLGDTFDPKLHTAIESEGEGSNIINEIVKDGYMLHDRVIQPVTVKIGKKG